MLNIILNNILCERIKIKTAYELLDIQKYSSFNSFELQNDLDFQDIVSFKPITFKGTIDGNGFSILNLKIKKYYKDDNMYVASLFDNLCSETFISNLVINSSIELYTDLIYQSNNLIVVSPLIARGAANLNNVTITSLINLHGSLSYVYVGGVVAISSGNVQVNSSSINISIINQQMNSLFWGNHYFGGVVSYSNFDILVNNSRIFMIANSTSQLQTFSGAVSGKQFGKINLNLSEFVLKINIQGVLVVASLIGDIQQQSQIIVNNVLSRFYVKNNSKILQQRSRISLVANSKDYIGSFSVRSLVLDINCSIPINLIGINIFKSKEIYLFNNNVQINSAIQALCVVLTEESRKISSSYQTLDFKNIWGIKQQENTNYMAFLQIQYNGGVVCENINDTCGLHQSCQSIGGSLECQCIEGYVQYQGKCIIQGCEIVDGIVCGDASLCIYQNDSSSCSNIPFKPCHQCHIDNGTCNITSSGMKCDENLQCQQGWSGEYCDIEICVDVQKCEDGSILPCKSCNVQPPTYCFIMQDVLFCENDICTELHFVPGCVNSECLPGFIYVNNTCIWSVSGGADVIPNPPVKCNSLNQICGSNALCNQLLECSCQSGFIPSGSSCVPTLCNYDPDSHTYCENSTCIISTNGSYCESLPIYNCTTCHTFPNNVCKVVDGVVICEGNYSCQPGFQGQFCDVCILCQVGAENCSECMVEQQHICWKQSQFNYIACSTNYVCQPGYNVSTFCIECLHGYDLVNGHCVPPEGNKSNNTTLIAVLVSLLLLLVILAIILIILYAKKKKISESAKAPTNSSGSISGAQDTASNHMTGTDNMGSEPGASEGTILGSKPRNAKGGQKIQAPKAKKSLMKPAKKASASVKKPVIPVKAPIHAPLPLPVHEVVPAVSSFTAARGNEAMATVIGNKSIFDRLRGGQAYIGGNSFAEVPSYSAEPKPVPDSAVLKQSRAGQGLKPIGRRIKAII